MKPPTSWIWFARCMTVNMEVFFSFERSCGAFVVWPPAVALWCFFQVQVSTNGWFAGCLTRWFGFLTFSPYERDCYLGRPLEFQTTKPNHQFIISWKLKVQDISIILKYDFLGYIGLANFEIRKTWANILPSDFLKISEPILFGSAFFAFFFPWFSLRRICMFCVFVFPHLFQVHRTWLQPICNSACCNVSNWNGV